MKCCDIGNHVLDPDVIGVRIVRARKIHICCECMETISPGECYEYVSGLWDGEWASFKTCIICKRIRDDYFDRCGFGDLKMGLMDCLGVDLC